ncbi:MAG: hypothetical protein GYA14_08060 [Ignavibacteria bacterium]|jgi:hypothetical protein|nr:hypothetical protein [Paludibacteraceae bacterium]NMB81757.1 hypothetical protein [Ignavibacteria bacterium]
MKKIIYYIAILIGLVFVFSSCKNEVIEDLDLTGDVNIHSFTINGVKGTIDSVNLTISVILPAGSSLVNLTPEIIIGDGATITPTKGTAVDFIDAQGNLIPVIYTVTNKNLYQKYTVTVDVAKAKITKFKIGSVEGDIDEANKKIIIYLPVGTDVTKLIPVVEYTEGAEMSPKDGSVVDFTNPVNYTLTYLGSTFIYEVTIILGEKPKPVLVIYNGETVSPVWESIASTITNGAVNPKTEGINTSSTCVSIIRRKEASDDGGRAWSGGALWHTYQVNIDPAVYTKFTLMVLKNTAGDVQIEIQSAGEQYKDYLKASYSANALGQWQELTFEVPESRTAIINNILVAPHVVDTQNDPNFTTQTMYWDELKAYPKN